MAWPCRLRGESVVGDVVEGGTNGRTLVCRISKSAKCSQDVAFCRRLREAELWLWLAVEHDAGDAHLILSNGKPGDGVLDKRQNRVEVGFADTA